MGNWWEVTNLRATSFELFVDQFHIRRANPHPGTGMPLVTLAKEQAAASTRN
jgi:hypothetical protein